MTIVGNISPDPEDRAARPAPARAGHEFTYREGGDFSYIADRVLKHKSIAARERLQRHGQEMDALRAEREKRTERVEYIGDERVEYRFNPSLVTGQGGELAPPGWLIDKFATAPRPGRVLSAIAKNFPLPKGIQSVNIPRFSTGNIESWQGNDNTQNAEQDALTANAPSEVVTISGEADVALQLLEQSPVGAHTDWVFFKDLSEAYDYNLEQQLITGTGSGTITAQSQLPGLLNLTGTNAITFTSASPTGSLMFTALGQAAAQIGKNRYLPPEAWLLPTSRWAWLMSAEDTQLRPFEMPDLFGANNPLCPGAILGWPAWCDDAIPRTLGATANYDTVIACRPSDIFIFESNPVSSSHLDVLSGTLQARLVYRNYVAAITGRQPAGISYLTGTGMVIQNNF